MATKLGGYGTSGGDAGLGSNRDFVDAVNTLSAGTVSQVKVYLNSVGTNGNKIKFKVFRVSGSDLVFVGQSEEFLYASLSVGLNTFNLTNTIACQAGDLLGVCQLGDASGELAVDTSGGTVYYKTGDITSGSTSIASFSSGAWGIIAEFWDTSSPAASAVRLGLLLGVG